METFPVSDSATTGKNGSAEGQSPFAGGLRVSLRYNFFPFLARPVLSLPKGKGRMGRAVAQFAN